MAKPVLVIVDDEDASRRDLARELESRYGAHYRIVPSPSPELALLTEFRAQGVAVPLVLADHWMPGMTGTEFLARVKDVMPTARRGLLTSWGDRSTFGPIREALAVGQMEFYLPRPAWSPDWCGRSTIRPTCTSATAARSLAAAAKGVLSTC